MNVIRQTTFPASSLSGAYLATHTMHPLTCRRRIHMLRMVDAHPLTLAGIVLHEHGSRFGILQLGGQSWLAGGEIIDTLHQCPQAAHRAHLLALHAQMLQSGRLRQEHAPAVRALPRKLPAIRNGRKRRITIIIPEPHELIMTGHRVIHAKITGETVPGDLTNGLQYAVAALAFEPTLVRTASALHGQGDVILPGIPELRSRTGGEGVA